MDATALKKKHARTESKQQQQQLIPALLFKFKFNYLHQQPFLCQAAEEGEGRGAGPRLGHRL